MMVELQPKFRETGDGLPNGVGPKGKGWLRSTIVRSVETPTCIRWKPLWGAARGVAERY